MAAILLQALVAVPSDIHSWDWLAVVALIGAPVVAAAAIWSRPLALQLLARAFWWVQLLVTSIISIAGSREKRLLAFVVASACALLSAGRVGLEESSSGRFRPVAFRGTLMLALVLAMGDAGAFSWIGLMQLIEARKVGLIVFAPPMIAGVIGLLRLRTWGLLVSVACNVAVAVAANTRLLYLSDQIRALFIANAIVQLMIPLPMWIAIIRRRPPPPDRWQRAKAIGVTCVIVSLMAIAIGARFVGSGPIYRPL